MPWGDVTPRRGAWEFARKAISRTDVYSWRSCDVRKRTEPAGIIHSITHNKFGNIGKRGKVRAHQRTIAQFVEDNSGCRHAGAGFKDEFLRPSQGVALIEHPVDEQNVSSGDGFTGEQQNGHFALGRARVG